MILILSGLGPLVDHHHRRLPSIEASSVKTSIFVNMFCDTNTRHDPSAHARPLTFADNSSEHANMTPSVNGSSEAYVEGEYRTPNTNRYANTVNNGDSAFTVCTTLTGTLLVAILPNICPAIWNPHIGSVVDKIRRLGIIIRISIPLRRRNRHTIVVTTHHPLIIPNCTKVSVIGRCTVFKIVLDVLLVSALDRYHSRHSTTNCTLRCCSSPPPPPPPPAPSPSPCRCFSHHMCTLVRLQMPID